MSDNDNRVQTVPPSVDEAHFRIITAHATVREVQDLEGMTLESAVKAASWMPMVTSGEPTKLHVVAWLGHEGMNRNRLVFRAEDLPKAAAKIGGGNPLPMDWNHSAVVPQGDLPKAIGAWYKAEAKWNPEARNGQGAMGVEAHGVVWAWAFQDYAKEMLAMQMHRGYVEFSMACIPTKVEMGEDSDGRYEIAIDPVFFTLSALNVPPADPDAKGQIMTPEYEEVEEYALALQQASEEDPVDDSMDADVASLEPAIIHDMFETGKDAKTNFPARGDNKSVSLRNSQWKTFPLAYAKDLQENWPEIWRRGGNIRGNSQFKKLSPVAARGGAVESATEEAAVRLREAWVARHYEDHQLAGVVAQVKWLAVGSRGLDHMKSVLNEAKQRVKARRAMHAQEEAMDENTQHATALEAALEANSVLKAEVERAGQAQESLMARVAELEVQLASMTAQADDAALKRDALQAELASANEQLAAFAAELETAKAQIADVAAKEEKAAREARWAARFNELPESYRAAFAKRSDEEQARFAERWSVASDEAWGEFRADLSVAFADSKISYLNLSQNEGKLPNSADSASDLGARIAALTK